MTDYIENMMKTARIKPCYQKRIECKDGYEIGHSCNNPPCISCDKAVFEDVYPVFTAEKQLEIIKLIGKSTDLHYFGYGMSSLSESSDEGVIEVKNNDFPQALARLTTELMKANELDKKKVKGILEDAR